MSRGPTPERRLADEAAQRLQRLILELFSDAPFVDTLDAAASSLTQLLGADHAAFYFCDALGLPECALRQGDARFLSEDAQREERDVMRRAIAEGRAIFLLAERSWLAAPLPGELGPDGGALIVAWLEPSPTQDESRRTFLSDAARLIKSARAIKRDLERRKELAAVTEQSPDAILTTDLRGRVVSCNTSTQELFGYARAELIGKDAATLVPDELLLESGRYEKEAQENGRGVRFETFRRRKDSSLIEVEARYTPLKSETGEPIGTVRTFHDIAQRKQVERMKDEFIQLVTHELRTPLTAINGFAETLYEDPDVDLERRRSYLKVIVDESHRLGKLVNDFLDISRLESGVAPPKRERLDLPALVGKVEALFTHHASRARLTSRFAPNATHAWGDPEQVYRLLINLCGNALKYSPVNGVVAVETRRDGAMVEVSVTDQGPGLAPNVQKRLFEKFFRASDAVSRKTPGSGLGLAICRSIVEAHGGGIWATNAQSGGASFRFTIPAEPKK